MDQMWSPSQCVGELGLLTLGLGKGMVEAATVLNTTVSDVMQWVAAHRTRTDRQCKHCAATFTGFGRAKYCGKPCASAAAAARRKAQRANHRAQKGDHTCR